MSRNELANAASPYLLQHRDNPVHWKEWTLSALAEAQSANKPILLSIGYAACHWCHVMAHESFEDESTAELMNKLFVNIKVDREERPDIDQIYMAALHALGQPGGWPMTMFLTPSGEPFWGGTYFPREASFGRPSFKDILTEISRTFHSAPDRIANNIQTLREAVTKLASQGKGVKFTNNMLDDFARRLYPHMDSDNGGLQGAPKFPNPQILELFLRAAERTIASNFSSPALLTLKHMILGGIHDQIGGGFARYAVDTRWHIPHFEKMLYDNAQILELLGVAWARTGDFLYRTAAESIVDWLLREMTIDDGAFAASMDADSEGVEGKYYCWTKEEIECVLSPDEARIFTMHYDIQPTGNWQEIHTGIRTNILNRLSDPDLTEETEAQLAPMRAKLLLTRNKRIPPLRDDKILADWNAMMIAALAKASFAFKKPEWLELATACFHSIVESMTTYEESFLRLAHSRRGNKLVWPGVASDYVFMIRAALILNSYGAQWSKVDHNSRFISYIDFAKQLVESLIHFHANTETGLLSLPAFDARDVVFRTFITADDATPNPNSILLQSLYILAGITGEHRYTETAQKIIRSILPSALENPFGHASFLNAIDVYLNGSQIIVLGNHRQKLLDIARNAAQLNRFVSELDHHSTITSTRFPPSEYQKQATAYICTGQECSLPISSTEQLASALTT